MAANDDRIAAVKLRTWAMFKNLDRRAENAIHYHFLKSPETHLVPLVDLRTGNEINGFSKFSGRTV
ncbi:hypothetical protein CI102_8081 [Trichoderma harzianum]|uniref:Uncharacterized protein n=1 Tax=Trichoderma harzianum CBS 226.95 TaxID=983964 RepID=A0A2T4A213_TRIHA|nr:hypothetical protein M431DRAFT_8360 [Trichoderma harzianum CBS 226.95]PKK45696.1 hypothetical protein CI102_8081 [Trichoderma harzianum]PTB51089.1 hypothetical protein M431DRAFT_8360 [Trichoderma harzianum CBS 226.95]